MTSSRFVTLCLCIFVAPIRTNTSMKTGADLRQRLLLLHQTTLAAIPSPPFLNYAITERSGFAELRAQETQLHCETTTSPMSKLGTTTKCTHVTRDTHPIAAFSHYKMKDLESARRKTKIGHATRTRRRLQTNSTQTQADSTRVP